eukprot:1230214-Prymnesium_polylepis.2
MMSSWTGCMISLVPALGGRHWPFSPRGPFRVFCMARVPDGPGGLKKLATVRAMGGCPSMNAADVAEGSLVIVGSPTPSTSSKPTSPKPTPTPDATPQPGVRQSEALDIDGKPLPILGHWCDPSLQAEASAMSSRPSTRPSSEETAGTGT